MNKPRRRKDRLRTSVILGEDQHAQLAALAARNDVSVAWVIRQAIAKFLTVHVDEQELPLRLMQRRKG